MDRRRLSLVRAGGADGFRRVGTGYLIGRRLVLTARHVIEESRGAPWPKIDVRVGHPQDAGVRRCWASVCWTAPEERDVALLLLDGEVDVAGMVRWGRPVGNTPLPYEGLGYPWATFRDGQHKVEHLRGKLPPQAGGVGAQDLYVLDQESAPDMRADGEQAWSGASGSAVFCRDHLVGVVIHDDHVFANRRLHACPARTFTSDPAFAAILQRYGDGPPELVDLTVEPISTDEAKTDGPGPEVGPRSATEPTALEGRRARSRHPVTLDDNLHTLALRVLADLGQDQVQQQLRSGHPLPLRCRAAPEEVTGRRNGARETSAALANASPLDLAGPLKNIAAVYLKERRSQLLVLGRAGSGKTVLIRRFAQARLEDADWTGKGPVPVIFSLGSWDPTVTSLRDWLIDRLERDHPFLARRVPYRGTWATELIVKGHVLAILDGFDEMAEDLYEPALRHLRAFKSPLLLTSRHEALRGVKPSEGLFPGIELTDLTLDDCSARLDASIGWAPVLDRLSSHSGEPAAARLTAVLTTPLMLTMAEAFHASGGDPACLLELAEFSCQDALEQRLLDAFVPTRYDPILNLSVPKRRRWNAERAGHWLGYLATHLKQQKTDAHKPDLHVIGAQDIEWWQLGTTMSLPARMVVSGALCGLVSGSAIALVHAALISDFLLLAPLLNMFLNVLGIGLAFGLMHGFASKIQASGAFKPSRMQIRVRSESKGARSRRARESLLPRVGGGLAGGLLFGIVYGGGTAIYAMLLSYPWSLIPLFFRDRLVAGLLLGLAAGIVLALVAWLETDAKPEESVSATDLLRTNRTIVLVQAAAVGLVLGLGYGIAITHFNGFALGLPSGIGAGLAAAVGVGTLTAWGRWVVLVRLWLPLSRRLPWRVNAFLDDARARGVLRQAGAVYQFRHARLRDRLAEAHRQHEQPTEGGST
ncbi:NACHT domain-containing protein [Nonomuraea angiospora]|uniref:NACHT domain-containing protein n=1 Tax=Nonomuraea angiospora TaxID=46172 RepID=UPI0034319949